MSWEEPERRWTFVMGDDPPGDLPVAWAAASRAVNADLGCRRYGRRIEFHDVMWTIVADQGFVCVGFALTGESDVGAYYRGKGFRLMTTTAQALVWLADDVQEELTGHEFVQWPMMGQRILYPRIVDDQAWWVDPATNSAVARIGELCCKATLLSACRDGWLGV